MNVLVLPDYDRLSQKAAEIIRHHIEQGQCRVLGLATGSTPMGLYRCLIQYYNGGLDFSFLTTFNLDEYVGLAGSHSASYRHFMDEQLFSWVNIPQESIHVPNGMAPDLDDECLAYERKIIAAGGIDLQVLGIGHNGHIGFNEPGTPFHTVTHCVALDERTREANARFFDNDIQAVPTRALSMGIKTIMRARHVLLLASGDDKAEAVAAAVMGPITTQMPGSVLQLHPHATILADGEAAALLDPNHPDVTILS